MNGERMRCKECDVHVACRWGSDHDHVTLGQFQHNVDKFKVKLLSFCSVMCSWSSKVHFSVSSALFCSMNYTVNYTRRQGGVHVLMQCAVVGLQ